LAQAGDQDDLTLWYKVADGDASDDDVTFSISNTNQYGWVYAEYDSTSGWGIDPLDVSALEPDSGYLGDTQVASGTTTTPSGNGLGVAMFRVRDGYAVSGLAFTNGYSLADSDGTQYGQAWSVEAIMAANTAATTTAQSTVASWTNGDRTGRMGVIAVFLPAGAQPEGAPVAYTTPGAVNAAPATLFDRDGGNAALQGALLIAPPGPIQAEAAAMLQTPATVTAETVYYSIGGETVAMRKYTEGTSDGVWWLLSDHLGSTGLAYKTDGSEVLRQYYYPWGGLRGSTDPVVPTDIGYTGQRLDTSTDLMYYNARYYDPAIGRFISPDTIVPNPTNPQDLSRYTYVRNNPVEYRDPSGHCIPAEGDIVPPQGRTSSSRICGSGGGSSNMGFEDSDRVERDNQRRDTRSSSTGYLSTSDWAGNYILNHYLYGDGKSVYLGPTACIGGLCTESTWSVYMQANPSLDAQLDELVLGLAADCAESGICGAVYQRTNMVIDNGEGVVGYQYLHGSNAEAGGFEVEGTASQLDSSSGLISVDLTYTWNDIMDPNPEYLSDRAKAAFAELITLGGAESYDFHVTWKETYVVSCVGTCTLTFEASSWFTP